MGEFDPALNAARRIVPHGVRELSGFRIKVYGFRYEGGDARKEAVDAAVQWAESKLALGPTARRHHGVGFLGVNDGNGSVQVFLDVWAEQNELHHYIQVAPKDKPAELADPPPDYNSVCVWDLAVQCHEREAWVRHVLRGSGDVEAYLDDFLDAHV